MGYDTGRFTCTVDEELICTICGGVLEDPLQAPACEHAFCAACIHEWLNHQQTCPVDRRSLTPHQLKQVPRILKNLLSKLTIKCENDAFGCEGVVRLDQLQSHLSQCEHNPKRPVNCENCTKNRLCQSHELQHEHLEQYYNVQNFQSFFPNESCTSSLAGDVIGCLLFHHSQQMACNVHAITAIVSTGEDKTNLRTSLPTKDHVVSREQKRIATAVYPTASLLNHACDPDVIVR